MALVKTVTGSKLRIKIGNGASTEVFTHLCMINTSRGFSFNADLVETLVPDCDLPDSPGWKERQIEGLSIDVDGAGKINTPDIEFFNDWWISGLGKNVQLQVDALFADGGGHWEGELKLQNFSLTGPSQKEHAEFEGHFVSNGAFVFVQVT